MAKLFRVVVLLIAVAFPASGDTFVNVPGLPGSSNAKSHPDWIEIESFQIAVAPPVLEKGNTYRTQCSAQVAMMAGATELPAVQLVGSSLTGPVTVEKSNPQTGQVYLRYLLEDVTIVSYATGGAGSDALPTESISLNFGRIEITYTPQKKDGTSDAPVKSTWDCDKETKK